jgi:hypothetical protein
MKRILAGTLLLLFTLPVLAQLSQKEAQDTIIWNSAVPLTKDFFLAKRSKYGKDIPAYIVSAIYLYQKEKDGTRMFYIEAIMLKSKSYMKEETPYILNHEQLHFDICELYARKLRQRIAEKDFTKVKDIVSVVSQFYEKTTSEYQKRETAYDNDTQHGINAAKQKVWNETIARELAELEQFASPEVNIER